MSISVRLFLLALAVLAFQPFNQAAAQSDPPSEEETSGESKSSGPVWQYSPEYRKSEADMQKVEDDSVSGILPNFIYAGTFLRLPDAAPGDLTLRIISPVLFTGCVKHKNPTIEIKTQGDTMYMDITDAVIENDKSVRYAHYQCDVHNRYAYIDLPLNRDELIKNGTKKIVGKNKLGRLNEIAMNVTEERITITTKSTLIPSETDDAPETLDGDTLTFWFYPPNTVILNVPRANPDADVRSLITQAARARGLMPLQEVFLDFEKQGEPLKGAYYFVDQSGITAGEAKTAGKPVLFGTIATPEKFYTADGAQDREKSLEIFARLPGLHE